MYENVVHFTRECWQNDGNNQILVTVPSRYHDRITAGDEVAVFYPPEYARTKYIDEIGMDKIKNALREVINDD